MRWNSLKAPLTLQSLLKQVHESELDVVLGIDVGRQLLGEGVARPKNVLFRGKPYAKKVDSNLATQSQLKYILPVQEGVSEACGHRVHLVLHGVFQHFQGLL